MLRLVCSSIPRVPAERCLLDIAREAEKHHADEGCCSLLYFHDFRFVHVVEGPAIPVTRYATRLRMDDRQIPDWEKIIPIRERAILPALRVGMLTLPDLPVSAVDRPECHADAVLEDLLVAAQVKYPGGIEAGTAIVSPLETGTPGHGTTGRLPDSA
ncbi:BLUF domain-containing protein [Allosediminivita pacifica]|uniref:BLUF domain-containing protein n=1 Tax=Allosediminivita pacifica TaxID=1267769 RepID=A0A2T6A1G0_9RHOB|nr:BLUF domain-containing protein [Allosediminivita pacifica]PTX37645.1 hypothetical protein C8N44_1484 [Allosediminivita pacifica]GGB29821.1 hypothetical protein GCM10011324_44210 [Allosediminivita pacifica]